MPTYTSMRSIHSILFVLIIIPSVLVLLLATSLLILPVNTSQAFTPQQQPPPATAGQPQQQLQTSQGNQSFSTQQNTTQLNQTAQQQQQIAPLSQLADSEDFAAGGTINSTIYTPNGNWEATGPWTLTVSDGELTSFDTDMAWNNGTAAHTHEFQNFVTDDDSDNISIDPEGGITIAGEMDVSTNGVVSWPSVPAEIVIQQGKIITVSLDHEDTDNHFGGQSVHGTVTSLQPCSATPGANMQIPTGGC
jgi:hypothetical protein